MAIPNLFWAASIQIIDDARFYFPGFFVIVVAAPFRRSVWFLIFNIQVLPALRIHERFSQHPAATARTAQASSSAKIADFSDIAAKAGLTAENIFGGEEIKN